MSDDYEVWRHQIMEQKRRAAAMILLLSDDRERRCGEMPRKKKRFWVNKVLSKRDSLGAFELLVPDINSADQFEDFFRMKVADFNYLLSRISHRISKQNTNMREAISPKERLLITLRSLATGKTNYTLHKIKQRYIYVFFT